MPFREDFDGADCLIAWGGGRGQSIKTLVGDFRPCSSLARARAIVGKGFHYTRDFFFYSLRADMMARSELARWCRRFIIGRARLAPNIAAVFLLSFVCGL